MKKIPLSNVHVDELLHRTVQAGCQELHLQSGQPPLTRNCNGDALGELSEFESLNMLDLMQMVYAILTDEQISQLEQSGALRFPYFVAHLAEFGVHVARFQGITQAEFHVLPSVKPAA